MKKACLTCLKNCARLHGDEDESDDDPEEESTPADSSGPVPKENVAVEPSPKEDGPAEPYPSFLKKMTELSIKSALQMPDPFVKSSVTRIGTRVTLEGPGNEKREVQIVPGKEKYSLEFGDGWHKFAVDHVLQIGDQLSFTLSAESHFQVVVYDESGSQKISATDAINSSPSLQQSKMMEVDQGVPSVTVRNKPSARPKQKVRRRIRTEGTMPPVKPDIRVPVVHSSESELRNSDTPEKEKTPKETTSGEKADDEPVAGTQHAR